MEIKQALEVADNPDSGDGIDRYAALVTLATAYREAMTLRHMDSAPCDKNILVLLPNDVWAIESADDYKYQRAIGWLPLPTPINEGE